MTDRCAAPYHHVVLLKHNNCGYNEMHVCTRMLNNSVLFVQTYYGFIQNIQRLIKISLILNMKTEMIKNPKQKNILWVQK